MGDKERLEAELNRYTYKPGVKIMARLVENADSVEVIIWSSKPDSRNPGRKVDVMLRRMFEAYWMDDDDWENFLQVWIVNLICEYEVHEVDEWLRRDGELVHDPHP